MKDTRKVFIGGMVAGAVTLISLCLLWDAVDHMIWAVHFISSAQ